MIKITTKIADTMDEKIERLHTIIRDCHLIVESFEEVQKELDDRSGILVLSTFDKGKNPHIIVDACGNTKSLAYALYKALAKDETLETIVMAAASRYAKMKFMTASTNLERYIKEFNLDRNDDCDCPDCQERRKRDNPDKQ